MASSTHRGRCFCGQLHFQVAGTPSSCCNCHCASCRHATGAPFVAWVTFDRQAFSITAGELTEYASSPGAIRGCCSACGTSLTYRNDARPEQIDLTTVVLEDAHELVPTAHIWVQDKLPWIVLADDLPQYARWTQDG